MTTSQAAAEQAMSEPQREPAGAAARRSAPAAAISVKRQEAAANRQRIAAAIVALQRTGAAINVQSVARAAQVHPDTVRRSGDLYSEVKRLRSGGHQPHADAAHPARSSRTDQEMAMLKGRLLAAQAEVVELRRSLASATQTAHQALGTAGTLMDADTAARLRQDNADLSVVVMDQREEIAVLRDAQASLGDELSAAHETNRRYVRELTAANERALVAEQALGLSHIRNAH